MAIETTYQMETPMSMCIINNNVIDKRMQKNFKQKRTEIYNRTNQNNQRYFK